MFDNADLGFVPSDLSVHFPVSIHLRVAGLLCPSSVMSSAQAQFRRLERLSGKQERERLRKRLAQQFTPSVSSTQPQASSASAGKPPSQQQPTGTAIPLHAPSMQFAHTVCALPASLVLPVRLIHFNIDLRDVNGDQWCSWMSRRQYVFLWHQLERLPAP